MLDRHNHSSSFDLFVSDDEKGFMIFPPVANLIKLFGITYPSIGVLSYDLTRVKIMLQKVL